MTMKPDKTKIMAAALLKLATAGGAAGLTYLGAPVVVAGVAKVLIDALLEYVQAKVPNRPDMVKIHAQLRGDQTGLTIDILAAAIIKAEGLEPQFEQSIDALADAVEGKDDQRLQEAAERFIKDLKEQTNLLRQISTDVRGIVTALHEEPPLKPYEQLNGVRTTLVDQLLFRSEQVQFIGREAELTALQEFLGDPTDKEQARFKWWIVTGRGGSGKSRAALELCRRNRDAWQEGFLLGPDPQNLFGWDRWTPERPILIVIDYVQIRAHETGQCLARLARRQSVMKFPIRVLLIERDFRKNGNGELQQWAKRMVGRGDQFRSITASCHKRDLQGHPIELELPALDAEDAWSIMLSIVPQPMLSESDRSGVEAQLRSIDPAGTPLYAALVAHALKRGTPINQLNRGDVTDELLRRERDRWDGITGFHKEYERLLALATIVGGIRIPNDTGLDGEGPSQATAIARRSQQEDACIQELAKFEVVPANPEQLIYAQMIGRSAGQGFQSLEPDILGELFVLGLFGDPDRWPSHPHDAFRLRDAAVQIGRESVGIFLGRCISDAPDHPGLQQLLAPCVTDPLTTAQSAAFIAEAILQYCEKGCPDRAVEQWQSLCKLVRRQPHKDPDLTLLLQEICNKVGFNFTTTLVEQRDLAAAEGIATEMLKSLGISDLDEMHHELIGKAMLNLVWGFCAVEQVENATRVLESMLSHRHPKSGRILLLPYFVRASFEALLACVKAGQYDLGKKTLQSVIRECSPEHKDVWYDGFNRASHTCLMAIEVAAMAGQAEFAKATFEGWQQLMLAYHGERTLRQLDVRASLNLVRAFARAGLMEDAHLVRNHLEAMANYHPADMDCRESVASADAIMAEESVKRRDLGIARLALERLVELAAKYPQHPSFRGYVGLTHFKIESMHRGTQK